MTRALLAAFAIAVAVTYPAHATAAATLALAAVGARRSMRAGRVAARRTWGTWWVAAGWAGGFGLVLGLTIGGKG